MMATEFKIYSTANGLSNNWITAIVESPANPDVLWIGTIAGGVVKIKNDELHVYNYGDDPNWNNVSSLCVDKNGTVWYTVFNGLLKIDNGIVKTVNDTNAPKNPTAIVGLDNGTVWFAEGKNIYIYNSSKHLWKISNYNLSQSCEITSLLADQDSLNKNLVWLGTSDKSILLADDSAIIKKSAALFGTPNELLDDGNGHILYRDHNNFYSLLKKDLTSQNVLSISENENLPADITSPFMFDNENNLWIGTWTNGVLKNSDINFLKFLYPSKTDEGNNIAIDEYGNIWTGGNKGIWEYYKDETQYVEEHFFIRFIQVKNLKMFMLP